MNWREVWGNPNASAGDIVRQACPWLVEEGRIAEYLREQYQYDRWAEEEYKLYALQNFNQLAEDDDDLELDEQDFDELAEQVLNEWYEKLAEQMFDEIYDSDDLRLHVDMVSEMVEWLKDSDMESGIKVEDIIEEWLEYQEDVREIEGK